MKVVRLNTVAGTPAAVRLVWLPGAAMSADDIAAQGWGDQLRARAWPVAMDAVDLEGERLDGADAIQGLVSECLQPAREAGERVWLAGISLGGWQSVLCSARHGGLVDGLCLFSPYPGDRLAWLTVERAGGLDRWTPVPGGDPALEVWAWWQRPPSNVRVWMGYGRQDRFADGLTRMAERLPNGSDSTVHPIEGGHDWVCWNQLWNLFLGSGAMWPASSLPPASPTA